MTTYENIQELKSKGLLKQSIDNGIISPVYLDYVDIYESFLKLRESGEYKMQCYYAIAMDFCISVDNVRKVVARMKS